MAWNADRARARIIKMRDETPDSSVAVRDFGRFIAERTALQKSSRADADEPIWFVPRNQAVTTHGVHIYANLMDYNDKLVEQGRETESSHADSLQFLHQHYRACDQLIAAFEIQRVDFHGSRLHAVVLTPLGVDREHDRIAKAVAFAAAFREMVARVTADHGERYRTRVRVGIDTGPAVAVNSGKRTEPEPLFIGSPANHAAKLATGANEGVYLSPRAQMALLGTPSLQGETILAKSVEVAYLDEQIQLNDRSENARDRLEEAYAAFRAADAQITKSLGAVRGEFQFHRHTPPLQTIDYIKLYPSNSIRMPLVSVFCDMDGFTAYIDDAIATGRVAESVANLHVLRGEMAAVLRDDFNGRKVRFIGDCLHGVVAEGTSLSTDEPETVDTAVYVAGGIRSSFDLCKALLPNISGLGIAIGLELGWTPISRLGLRGESGVRCSSSRATCLSEEEQQRCNGEETALGESAYNSGRSGVRRVFGTARIVRGLTYANAVALLQGVSAPAVARQSPEPFRAHTV